MMNSIKTRVTVATVYVTFTDKAKAGETKRILFLNNPTKAEVKTEYEKTLSADVKKVTVCELDKLTLEIDFTSATLVKTLESFITEYVKTITEFETVVIY